MRFEVNVDDGANFTALHKAREAFNVAHPQAAAPDMPSFVQALMDQAVAGALKALPAPSTLSAALSKIAELEAANITLTKEVAAATAVPAPAPVTAAPAA
jgi:hypothetical protein